MSNDAAIENAATAFKQELADVLAPYVGRPNTQALRRDMIEATIPVIRKYMPDLPRFSLRSEVDEGGAMAFTLTVDDVQ